MTSTRGGIATDIVEGPDRDEEQGAPATAGDPLGDEDATPSEPAPDPDAQLEPTWTIDEFATEVGIPTRTVRHYQSERVLPPPQRVGRVAHYGPEHAERVRLIAELQDRGLSLRAIRDALREVEKGRLSLDGWLGLGEQLRRPWSDDTPLVLSEEELAERLGDRRPGLRAELARARLLEEAPGGGVVVRSPALLDIVLELDDSGVDVATATEAGRIVGRHVGKAAEELVDRFIDRLGDGFGRSADPEDLAEALERLRNLSADAVGLIFAERIQRAARERLGELGPQIGKSVKKRKER